MLFPKLKQKIGVKKNIPGGEGDVEIFNIKKKYCHLLVKWEVVSPNSRWGQWESIYPI